MMKENQDLEFLETVYNNANLAIFVVDVDENRDFHFVKLNSTHEKLTGLRSSEIKGKRPEDLVPLIPQEAADAVRQRYLTCLQTGSDIEYEEMIPFNGEETWWLTKLSPLKDANGRIYRLIGTATSITSLKQTQKELEHVHLLLQNEMKQREDELERVSQQYEETTAQLATQWEQFKAVLENFSDVLYITDIDTNEILLTNKALADQLGFNPVGKICYEALQGFKEPCDFCTNNIIRQKMGKPHIWEYHNPTLEKDYYINDQLIKWPDGRDVRLEIAIDITERKHAQIQYETIIKTALEGFWVLDTQGNFLDVNDAYIQMSGYSRDELLSMNLNDIKASRNAPDIKTHFAQIMETGGAVFESQHQHKDGHIMPLEVSATYVNERGGRIYAFLRNITERKEAEEKLRRSEEKFRLIAENVSDVIWQMSPTLKFTYVTPSIFKMTGYTPEEWVGSKLSDHASPAEFRKMARLAMGALKDYLNFKEVTFETVFFRKDGTPFPCEVNSILITNEKGIPIGLQGITRDITARKARDEAVQYEKTRFKALIENAPDGITLVSPEGEFKYISPSALKMFGYDEFDSIEKGPNELTHPDDLPQVYTVISEIMTYPERVSTRQYRFLHKDGSWRWIESTFSNLLANPAVNAIVINFRDITEMREAQQVLDQKIADLERFNRLAVGRELTMIELKKEINRLSEALGQDPPYTIVSLE